MQLIEISKPPIPKLSPPKEVSPNQQSAKRPSPKKLRILEYMSAGMTYEKIAGTIFLSDLTIKSYVRDMKKKYKCDTATGLVCLAIRSHWIKNMSKK